VDSLGLVRIGDCLSVYNCISELSRRGAPLWAFVYRTKFGVLLRATAPGRAAWPRRWGSTSGGSTPSPLVWAAFMAGLGGAISSEPGRGARHGCEVLVSLRRGVIAAWAASRAPWSRADR